MLNGPPAAGESDQQGGPEADQGSEHPAPQYGSCLVRRLDGLPLAIDALPGG
jgi:hypothetical protein